MRKQVGGSDGGEERYCVERRGDVWLVSSLEGNWIVDEIDGKICNI